MTPDEKLMDYHRDLNQFLEKQKYLPWLLPEFLETAKVT